MRRLGQALSRTTRLVNTLEQRVAVRLQADIASIDARWANASARSTCEPSGSSHDAIRPTSSVTAGTRGPAAALLTMMHSQHISATSETGQWHEHVEPGARTLAWRPSSLAGDARIRPTAEYHASSA